MKTTSASLVAVALAFVSTVSAGATVDTTKPLPCKSEGNGQFGSNCCTTDSKSSNCQNAYIESIDDFCLWAPHDTASIGDSEESVVSWCTKAGHGTRLIPKGSITGAHYVETPHYRQITGVGKFTQMNIVKGDEGGELDPHGADGFGNPRGGLVLGHVGGKLTQFKEWTSFMSDREFCFRACFPGPDAARWCQHIYDLQGCQWNVPGSYAKNSFDQCKADDVAEPMGVYLQSDGSLSTWHQGDAGTTPNAQRAAKTSQCAARTGPIDTATYGAVTSISKAATATKKATSAKATSTKKTTTTKKTTKKASVTSTKKKTSTKTSTTKKHKATKHTKVARASFDDEDQL